MRIFNFVSSEQLRNLFDYDDSSNYVLMCEEKDGVLRFLYCRKYNREIKIVNGNCSKFDKFLKKLDKLGYILHDEFDDQICLF